MKEKYFKPDMEINKFECDDIVMISGLDIHDGPPDDNNEDMF